VSEKLTHSSCEFADWPCCAFVSCTRAVRRSCARSGQQAHDLTVVNVTDLQQHFHYLPFENHKPVGYRTLRFATFLNLPK